MPEVGALWAGLCAVGVNTILTLEGFLSPAPWAASSQPFPAGTTSFRVLRWEQKGLGGGGGAELVGTSSASRALSLFPSVPSGLALVLEPSAARAASDRHR